MATYADHPFDMIPTPAYGKKQDPSQGKVRYSPPPTTWNTAKPRARSLMTHAQVDMFDELASEMAMVHNMIARSLNAIYLQAPHIAKADEQAFVRFARSWHTMVSAHHRNEETHFFPAVEAMAGKAGIMAANVDQHHRFEVGLAAFRALLDDITAGRVAYDGAALVKSIDAFAPALMEHLRDEIPTLLSLRAFGEDKMKNLMVKAGEEGQKTMVRLLCKRKHGGGEANVFFVLCRRKSASRASPGSLQTSTRATRAGCGPAGRRHRRP